MITTVNRRIHLYLALALSPWVLMYAVSTFVMNHRAWFRGEPPAPPAWETVSSGVYEGEFPTAATPKQMAVQLLSGLGLEGAHQASVQDGRVVILRHLLAQPVRITYEPKDRRLTVERQVPDTAATLERMHRRRGRQQPYPADHVWAFMVDLFIAAMFVWTLSGAWMWWEMKATRRWGALSLAAGVALFGLFLAVL